MARTNQAAKTKKTTAAPAPDRKVPVVGIVFGLVAVAVVAAIAFGGGGGPSDFDPGSPTVSGQLPVLTGGADQAIGMEAPRVTGEDFDGAPVAIENDGTAKGIVFLAHWCPHCQREVPRVQDWLDGGGSVPGVEIYSVATAFNSTQPNYPPNDWLIREGWTPPVVVDDAGSSVYNAFGSGGFPFWVFVSADGTVTRRMAGELPIETLIGFLQEAAAA